MAKYRLIFRGKLAPGISREMFISRVARRLDESIEQVEKSFFGQRSVLVKETDDPQEAQRYRDVFQQLGAELELRSTGRMRWAAAAVVLLLLLGAAAAWYSQPLWRSGIGPDVARAEAALASPGVAVLLHLDVRRAVAIEERFLNLSDADSLPAPSGDEPWSALRQAGAEPRTAIDQAVVAARAEDGEWLHTAVFLGEFDPDAVRQGLEAAYQPAEGDGEHFYYRMLDPDTCEPSALMAAAITAERVVVAPASRIDDLLQRYHGGTQASINLSDWRRFRADRILSAAVFAPKALAGTAGGMTGMLLRGAESQLTALDSLFIGLAARALPPGVTLSGVIHAPDTDWIADQHAAARTALDSARRTLGQDSLLLARLLERIELERSPSSLGASINLDRNFREQLAAALSATLDAAFDPSTMASGGGPAGERVVEEPDRFLARISAAELPSFDRIDDSHFSAQWSDGPFGVRIQEAGVDPEDDDRGYLVLEAHGRDLPNIADKASGVRLRVADVVDAAGQSIMPRSRCGADRNQDPIIFESMGSVSYVRDGEFLEYRKHTAEKRIQLAPGATLDSVDQVRGVIEFDLPVRTAREVLQAPLAGTQVERNCAREAFRARGEGVLSFQTSGDTARILAVRALNADGQVLDSRGQTSLSGIFGAGRVINRNISGEIDQVEVIFATAIEALRYPFTLGAAYPPQDGAHYPRPAPNVGEPTAMERTLAGGIPEPAETFDMQPRATSTAGPAVLALQQLRSGDFYDFFARLRVRTPVVEGIAWNLSGGLIEIAEVAGADGEWNDFGVRRVFELEPQGIIVNGVFQSDEERPYMEADVGLKHAYDGPGVERLRGSVSLRVPTALRTRELEPVRLGRSLQADDLQLKLVAIESGGVRIAGQGSRDRLVAIHMFDGQDRRVDRGVRFEHAEDGGWSARVSIGSMPKVMKLIIADARVERSFEFALDAGGGDESS